jgi:hypothetical protein
MGRDIAEFRNQSIHEMPHSKVEATWKILGRLGFDAEICYRLRSDEKFRDNFIQGGLKCAVLEGQYSILDMKLQKMLYDCDFFSFDDWRFFFDKDFDDGFDAVFERTSWLKGLKNVLDEPCPFVKGQKVKDTHFLYYLPSFDYSEIDSFLDEYFKMVPRFWNGDPCGDSRYFDNASKWHRKNAPAGYNQPRGNWFLCFLGVLPKAKGKKFLEQWRMVPPDYQVPFASEVYPMFRMLRFLQPNVTYHYASNEVSLYGFVADRLEAASHTRCYCLQNGTYLHSYQTTLVPPGGWGIMVSRKLNF